MSAADPRTPVLSSPLRRKLVHGGLIAVAVLYVGALVLAPLIGIAWAAINAGWDAWKATLTDPDAIHAYYLTAGITVVTVVVTGIFGVIVAMVLARDHFWGKSIVSAVVNLPFAVSPIIVGLMAVLLFGRGGWFEPWFSAHGIQVLFAVPSMVIVTIFICIPFVIREVAPVLQELGMAEEEASKTLGALGLDDVPADHAAEHPLGVALRDRALRRSVDRRSGSGAGGERVDHRQDRDRPPLHPPRVRPEP